LVVFVAGVEIVDFQTQAPKVCVLNRGLALHNISHDFRVFAIESKVATCYALEIA
jgi:hypothetical protein